MSYQNWNLNSKLQNNKNTTIVCVGDSHTWGQGATGGLDGFDPAVQCGELRPMGFDKANFVNLFREHMNMRTGSFCTEILYHSGKITANAAITASSSWKIFKDGYIEFTVTGRMLRLYMKCGPYGSRADILVDGVVIDTIDTYDTIAETPFGNTNYKVWHYDNLPDTSHTVRLLYAGKNPLASVNDHLYFYRAEAYSGKCIVINSGVGSRSTVDYLNHYWASYCLDYNPDLVIIEAFSINDWLRCTPLAAYKANLIRMINSAQNNGAEVLLVTVSPIRGNQLNGSGINYEDYIQHSLDSALETGVSIADANKGMREWLMSNSPANLFSDNWHVKDSGHGMYRDAIVSSGL